MFLVAAEHNPKKGSPPYSTKSNVFANDVHRTSSPRLNRPLAITFLNPTAAFSGDINPNSIVMTMTYGSVSFLFMSNTNADDESRIQWNVRLRIHNQGYNPEKIDQTKNRKKVMCD